METMKHSNDITDEELIDPAILAILRDLPCEQGEPSAESDLIIRRAAAARMAAIRRRSLLKRITTMVTAMAACLALGMFFVHRSQRQSPPPAPE